MNKSSINHKRLTKVVKSVTNNAIWQVQKLLQDEQEHPGAAWLDAMRKQTLKGIEFDEANGVKRTFVTVNEQFLTLVGYEGNEKGFLADYFGDDATFEKPLRFRYVDGFLINPPTKGK